MNNFFTVTFFIRILSMVYLLGHVTTSCTKKTTEKLSTREKTLSTATHLTVEGEKTATVVRANSDKTQTLSSQASAISGSSIMIQPGALTIDTQISIEPGQDITTTSVTDNLGLETTQISSASGAIVVKSAVEMDAQKPLILRLPINSGQLAGLSLATDQDLERLIVIYKIKSAQDGSLKMGIIPRSSLTIEDNFVIFESDHFGLFQLAYIDRKIEKKLEVETKVPIFTKTEAKKLPKFLWQSFSAKADEAKRGVIVEAKLDSSLAQKRCYLILDEDKTAPFLQRRPIEFKTQEGPTRSSFGGVTDQKHSFYARYACSDQYDRIARSPWSEKIELAAIAPTITGIKKLTNSATFVITPEAKGLSSYALAIATGSDDCSHIAYTPWKDITSSSEVTTTHEGENVLCIKAKDKFNLEQKIPTSYKWVYDKTPPTAPIISAPATTTNKKPTWSWQPHERGDSVEFRYKLDDKELTNKATTTNAFTFYPSEDLKVGTHTLFIQGRDMAGNWSPVAEKSIVIEPILPSKFTITGPRTTVSSKTFKVTWSKAEGASSYHLALSNSASCDRPINSYTTALEFYELSVAKDGVYHVCLKAISSDGFTWADNSAAFSLRVESEDNGIDLEEDSTTPPPPSSANIIIAGAKEFTKTTSVNLTLAATGASQMYITNTMGCSSGGSWEAYTTSRSWQLAQENAAAAVYVKFKNDAGAESNCVNDTIIHDSIAPQEFEIIPPASTRSPTNDNTLVVSWSASSGAVKYSLLVTQIAGCNWVNPDSSDMLTGTSKTLDNLPDGTHYLCLRAFDEAGNSSMAPEISFTIDTTAPSTATSLGWLETSPHKTASVTASWTKSISDDATSQTLQYYSDSSCSAALGGPVAKGALDTTDSFTGSDGATYHYAVTTTDTAGNSIMSACSDGITIDTSPPSGTITLAAGLSYLSNQAPGISLTGDSDISEYQLCADSATAGNECPTVLQAWSAYTDSPPPHDFGSDGSKTLYVQFKDAAGNVGATVSDDIVIDTIQPTAPASPSWPEAYVALNTVSLSWTGGSDAVALDTHYVKACTDSNCIDGCLSSTPSNTSPKDLGPLVEGSSYYGCVQAKDKAGNLSAWIASPNPVTIDLTPPNIEERDSILTPNIDSNAIELTWNPQANDNTSAPDQLKYFLYYSKDTEIVSVADTLNATLAPGSPFDKNTDSLGLSALMPNTLYRFNIVVEDMAGNRSIYRQTSRWTKSTSTASEELDIAEISSGGIHSCAVTEDHKAYCWGDGLFGKLGNGAETSSNVPVLVKGGYAFTSISAGKFNTYTCGVTEDHKAYCWGKGGIYGRLGNETFNDSNYLEPQLVVGGHPFKSISAGDNHTCAITTDDKAYCWGRDQSGKLGNGSDTSNHAKPQLVEGGYSFLSISVGANHSCALTVDNRVYCWGNGAFGKLGNGDNTDSPIPVEVGDGVSPFEAKSISAGRYHTCAIGMDDKAYCWGEGLGTVTSSNDLPQPTSGGHLFTSITAGNEHNCAIGVDNKAYCWGNGEFGRLGQNDPYPHNNSDTPLEVHGQRQYSFISAGGYHTCASEIGGKSYCWGAKDDGQLGDGATGAISQTYPSPISQYTP